MIRTNISVDLLTLAQSITVKFAHIQISVVHVPGILYSPSILYLPSHLVIMLIVIFKTASNAIRITSVKFVKMDFIRHHQVDAPKNILNVQLKTVCLVLHQIRIPASYVLMAIFSQISTLNVFQSVATKLKIV